MCARNAPPVAGVCTPVRVPGTPGARVRLTAVVKTHNGLAGNVVARADDARPRSTASCSRATEERVFLNVGIGLALLCAAITQLGFLCKHRGASLAPRVELRAPLRERPRPVPLALVRPRHGDRGRRLGPARRGARPRAAVARPGGALDRRRDARGARRAAVRLPGRLAPVDRRDHDRHRPGAARPHAAAHRRRSLLVRDARADGVPRRDAGRRRAADRRAPARHARPPSRRDPRRRRRHAVRRLRRRAEGADDRRRPARAR